MSRCSIWQLIRQRCGMSSGRRSDYDPSPSPAEAAIQPFDSSGRNPLIYKCPSCGLCGLRAGFRERGRSEEWREESEMLPGTARSGGWRSPQASAGTLDNTREPARSGKKKPQLITVGVLMLVEAGGVHGAHPCAPPFGQPSAVQNGFPAVL